MPPTGRRSVADEEMAIDKNELAIARPKTVARTGGGTATRIAFTAMVIAEEWTTVGNKRRRTVATEGATGRPREAPALGRPHDVV